MADLFRLSGSEALGLIKTGAVTVEEYAMSLLSRIRERNNVVQAWAYLDPDLVMSEARRIDQIPMKDRGPLHGLPVGIKDVAQTRGLLPCNFPTCKLICFRYANKT
jgi:amidase